MPIEILVRDAHIGLQSTIFQCLANLAADQWRSLFRNVTITALTCVLDVILKAVELLLLAVVSKKTMRVFLLYHTYDKYDPPCHEWCATRMIDVGG